MRLADWQTTGLPPWARRKEADMLTRLTAALVIGGAALLAAGVLVFNAPFVWLAAPPGRRAPVLR